MVPGAPHGPLPTPGRDRGNATSPSRNPPTTSASKPPVTASNHLKANPGSASGSAKPLSSILVTTASSVLRVPEMRQRTASPTTSVRLPRHRDAEVTSGDGPAAVSLVLGEGGGRATCALTVKGKPSSTPPPTAPTAGPPAQPVPRHRRPARSRLSLMRDRDGPEQAVGDDAVDEFRGRHLEPVEGFKGVFAPPQASSQDPHGYRPVSSTRPRCMNDPIAAARCRRPQEVRGAGTTPGCPGLHVPN
ncbi:hypothetical protein SAMN05216499_1552 [Actinacidiphila paucisporea]|uniref:Uncharacterized protein n=1 Tax=Actinacidiphila paucisporea TaxID=310782 RepID=A0A1M7QZP8_9ACTN|nr:hypothetical protein SAMN05216499_1552 [Actinacidiphila paucisporea]